MCRKHDVFICLNCGLPIEPGAEPVEGKLQPWGREWFCSFSCRTEYRVSTATHQHEGDH